MERKKTVLLLVVAFAVLYYIVRIAISLAGVSGDMDFEEEQPALVEGFVLYSFLGIGVAGLALVPGLLMLRPWGFWGTIAVSAYTIAFDLWAFVAVQSSAGAGMAAAAVIMGHLLLTRRDFAIGRSGR